MTERVFGTDGVRGVANRELTPELALAFGRAGAAIIGRASAPERPIVVGRDTRLSGTMLEAAVVAGITSAGRDVLLVGVIPTPGVARITALIEAAGGVMISASHNPIEDNGIKFFGADGFKLSDEAEAEIEAALLPGAVLPRPTHDAVGVVRAAYGLADRYFATLLEAGGDLRGLVVVLDAAFGAAYAIGPRVFEKLGARWSRCTPRTTARASTSAAARPTSDRSPGSCASERLRSRRHGSSASLSTATPTARCSSTRTVTR